MRSTAQFDLRIAYDEAWTSRRRLRDLKKEIERLAKDIESKKTRLADDNFSQPRSGRRSCEDLEATLAERQIEHRKLHDACHSSNKARTQNECQHGYETVTAANLTGHYRPAHGRAADFARREFDDRDQRGEDRQGNWRDAAAGVALDRETARSWACT